MIEKIHPDKKTEPFSEELEANLLAFFEREKGKLEQQKAQSQKQGFTLTGDNNPYFAYELIDTSIKRMDRAIEDTLTGQKKNVEETMLIMARDGLLKFRSFAAKKSKQKISAKADFDEITKLLFQINPKKVPTYKAIIDSPFTSLPRFTRSKKPPVS